MPSLSFHQPDWLLALALLLAWLLDAAFGEPRNALHPVAWLGKLLWPVGCWLRVKTPRVAMYGGAVAWLLMAAVLVGAAWLIEQELRRLPLWCSAPVLALLLKPMFAWRMLHNEVRAVEHELRRGIGPARERLARLVSRDTTRADKAAVRETAIETLAENLADSVIAPLFWYAVVGLPGAVLYRFANTADAMWGYRGIWEWAGKFAAHADDVLSWIPSRLTAFLLRPTLNLNAWRVLKHQASRTPSPNGGWPMGAMALRLSVRLTKPGVYALNENSAPPGSRAMRRALRYATAAAWSGWLIAMVVCMVRPA